MSDETLPVVIERVAHLTRRVETVETKLDAVLKSSFWLYGAAGGAGAVLMILLPKVSKVLGLS